ncbi:hypothetical protein D3C81_1134880 [compost metagenome]
MAQRTGQVQHARRNPLGLQLFWRLADAPHAGLGHRRYGIDQDAVLLALHAQGVHDADLGHLAGGIGHQPRLRIALVHGTVRGGQHYPWRCGALEVGPGMLGQPHGRMHIDAQRAMQEGGFMIFDTLVIDPAGIVDEDIQRAKLLDGQLDQLLAGTLVLQLPGVPNHRKAFATHGRQCVFECRSVLPLPRSVGAQVADDDLRTTFGQRHGIGQAQALCGTGDDRNFIVKRVCNGHFWLPSILLFTISTNKSMT